MLAPLHSWGSFEIQRRDFYQFAHLKCAFLGLLRRSERLLAIPPDTTISKLYAILSRFPTTYRNAVEIRVPSAISFVFHI